MNEIFSPMYFTDAECMNGTVFNDILFTTTELFTQTKNKFSKKLKLQLQALS